MDKKEKLLQKRVAGLFALLCVIFFQFFDSDHLFLKEEVVSVASLPEVLVGYWGKPAWLACSMAKVLTSLFVPVGGGAVLITAVLMLEWWASLFILRKFNVGDMAPLYALFPVVMEWGTYCSPYYHLNSILYLVIVLYIFCGYIQIKVKWLSWVTGFILLFAVYCMVGSRLFIFVILVLLYEAEIEEKHWVYWALLLITGTVLPEFLKELYSLSEEQAYQYPQAWLPAFFPAIMLACVLVATQFKKVRYMQISVWSVSVTSGLLLVLLALTAFSHAVG